MNELVKRDLYEIFTLQKQLIKTIDEKITKQTNIKGFLVVLETIKSNEIKNLHFLESILHNYEEIENIQNNETLELFKINNNLGDKNEKN